MLRLSLVSLSFLFLACSGSTVSVPSGDAGAGVTSSGSTIVATGSCSLETRGPDGSGAPRHGKATARLNGSGNVIVRCFRFDEGAEELELSLGNGTYDGARTYVLAGDHTDGNAQLETTKDATFEPKDSPDSGCKVEVTSPIDPEPARGALVKGTFFCKNLGLKRGDESRTLDITSGVFSAPME